MKKLSILVIIYGVALISLSISGCKEKADVWNPKATWYEDKDGDGRGNPLVFVYSDVQPVGYVADNSDNNDNLPCDEAIPFYADKDGDGLGDPNDIIMACTPPPGYVDNSNDNSDFAPIDYTPVDVPDPLFAFDFDENQDSIVHNTGSLADLYSEFGKTDPPTWSSNIPRSGGTSSLDFGTEVGNYYVESPSVIPELTGLTNVTVTGWVNNELDDVGAGGNRIVSWINNGGDGFDIVYMKGGSLNVGINQWPDKSAAISSPKVTTNPLGSVSNWIFFAVTYDANENGGTLKYYFGDNSTAATFDSEFSYALGPIGVDIGHLAIGHFNQESHRDGRTDRVFRGLIDQVRIFDKVLTSDQIITVQLQ